MLSGWVKTVYKGRNNLLLTEPCCSEEMAWFAGFSVAFGDMTVCCSSFGVDLIKNGVKKSISVFYTVVDNIFGGYIIRIYHLLGNYYEY